MEKINFEGLGLSFNINKVLVDINGLKIHWYAVIIVVGIIIAILLCKKDDGKYKIKGDNNLNADEPKVKREQIVYKIIWNP